MKTVIPLTLLVFIALGLFAQQTPARFSLKEAVDYAIANNKTLLNANSDLQVANEKIKEARGSGLPQLSATLDYMTNFNYAAELNFGGSNTAPTIDYTKLDAGDIEVLSAINQMFGSSSGSTIVMEDQASANLKVSQLLFSGQYWVGLQMSKIAKQMAETSRNLTELDVKESVISSYYLILVSEELMKIIDENQNNLKSVLKHTQDMFKAGVAEETDVDQLRINLSQLENSKKAMERNLQLNYNMFRFVLGIDNTTTPILTDKLDDLLAPAAQDFTELSALDLTKNPSYQILENQEKLGEKTVEMKKWAYTPTLAAYYTYKEKLMTTGFDLSPKNAAGLTLNVPIFSGLSKHAQLSQAKIELDKINRNKLMLEEQLALQNNQLSFELKNAFENYQTQKENVEVAQRVYNSINNKFQQGMVSSLDLTQANSNFLQAENNYISSILQLLQSRLKLDKLYNNL